jgi:hypothetical protein
LVVVISSCIGGWDGVVVVPGLASLLVSVPATSSDADHPGPPWRSILVIVVG